MPDNYEEFPVCPPYEHAVFIDGKSQPPTEPGRALWSNKAPPPGPGEVIRIRMNSLGAATVTGYFVQCGWLGVLCTLHDAPEWHRRQNKGDPKGHVFGAEIAIGESK